MSTKNTFVSLLIVFCALWLSTNSVQAQLTNGNFEAGTTGWFVFPATLPLTVDTAGAQEGAQCGKVVVPGNSSAFVQQKIWGPMNINGKTLRLTGWVKTAFGTGGTPAVGLAKAVKVANVFVDYTTADVHAGDLAAWTQLTGTFTLQAGPATDPGTMNNTDFLSPRITIDATGVTGDSTVWMDDFSLIEVVGDPNNALTDGSFELGSDQWAPWPTDTVTATPDTTDPKDGSKSMKLTIPVNAQSVGILAQGYAGPLYVKGKTLELSAWVKSSFGTGGTPSVFLHEAEYNADGSAANWPPALDSRAGNLAAWTEMKAQFTLIGGADPGQPLPTGASMLIRLGADTTGVTSTSEVWWDAVRMVEVVDDGNLLVNGSFEFGISPWQQWNAAGSGLVVSSVDATDAINGTKVAKMEWDSGPSARQLNQDIVDLAQAKLIPGRWLMLSAWYKVQVGNQKEFTALGRYFGDAGVVLDPVTGGTNGGNLGDQATWAKQYIAFRVPPTGDYKSLRVFGGTSPAGLSTAGVAYWDDYRLEDYDPTQNQNLLLNGSFEDGMLTWSRWALPTSLVSVTFPSDGTAQQGSKYAKIDFPSNATKLELIADFNTPDLDSMGVPDGTELVFSAWYRANVPADCKVWLSKVYTTANGTESGYEDNGGVAGPQSQWTKMTLPFTYVHKSTNAYMRLILRAGTKANDGSIGYTSGAAGWLNWDNVTVEKPAVINAVNNWELY